MTQYPDRCRSLRLALLLALVAAFLLGLFPQPAGAALPLVRLSGHVPAAVLSANLVGDVPAGQTISMAFVLPLTNQTELNGLLKRLYDRADPLYGHYLTPAQFAAQFGPTDSDVSAVAQYAQSQGFTVTSVSSNHTIVDVAAPAYRVEQAFSLHLRSYAHPDGRPFYAPDDNPAVPLDIAARLVGIAGLDNANVRHPMFVRPSPMSSLAAPQIGNGPNGSGLAPNDIKTAYNLTGVTANGISGGTPLNGAGQTLAVYELDGYLASDIQTYEQQYDLPNVPLQNVHIEGFSGTPQFADGQGEVTLDIELQIAMAPNASKIIVYEAPPSSTGVSILTQMADDDLAKSISICWGDPEDQTPSYIYDAEQQELMQMASQGQSVFVASGDNGAYDDPSLPNTLEVDDPGSQQYDTDVGGTTLTLNANGTYKSETTWNNAIGASGGGISRVWSIPGYQSPVVDASADTQLSHTMRNVPDVSLDADPDTGFSTYATLVDDSFDSGWTEIGGTSCGAPIWAGISALINQERAINGGPTLGLANLAFYNIAQGSNYHADFHDIANNSTNAYYRAEPGFDDATGLGTIDGANLLSDAQIIDIQLSSTITGTVSASGSPVAGATVSLELASTNQVLQTTSTLANGTYSLAAPPSMSVIVQADGSGYYSQQQQVTSPAATQTLPGVDFSLTPSVHTFPAGLQFISSPYGYTSGQSFATVLGDPAIEAAAWLPATFQYAMTPTPPADTFHLGQGYWMDPSQPVWLTLAGTPAPAGQTFDIKLQKTWNMIGDPFTSPVPLSSLLVSIGGAAPIAYSAAMNKAAVSQIYGYNGSAYVPLASSASLQPWVGYWIWATSANTTLELPSP